MMPPTVSVVIPTFNRRADLAVTLDAILAQSWPADRLEVVVVDNGSTDGTDALVGDYAARHGARIRYRRKSPEGPAAARNLGAQLAAGALVAFVDSDVSLDSGWIAAAAAALAAAPQVAMVGGKLIYASRPDRLNAFGGTLGRIGLAWDTDEGAAADSVTRARPTLWMNCSACLVRRAVFLDSGGFDERFFYGYEEPDLGYRLHVLGWRIMVIPEAVALHRVDEATGRSDPRIVFHYSKNRLRALLKNADRATLARALPGHLAYALVDGAARAPRRAKLAALAWNVGNIADTIRLRRAIQAGRRQPDSAFAHLIDRRWFPPQPLAGRRRRPVAGIKPVSAAAAGRDDRVG